MTPKHFKVEAEAELAALQHPGATVRKNTRGSGWFVDVPDPAVEAIKALTEAMRSPQGTPAPLDVWTFDENIMTEVIPPQVYAVRPYFPLECVTGFPGPGKVGKSYFMLLVMLSVAAGRPCLGCPVQQGHVWYFSAEDKKNRVKERVQEVLKDFTPEERAKAAKYFHCIDAVGKRLFFTISNRGAPEITDVCERISALVGKAVLVVVDTVSRINQLPENANESMALVVSAGEVIADRTGAAVVLNHHVTKAGARSGETDMYAGRGGGAFADNCRSLLTLSKATDAQVATFDERTQEQQRLGNVRVLTHSASSYGREALPVFLLRRDNGTFAKLDAVMDLLTPLAEWLNTKKLATFTRRMLTRVHAKDIWPATPSRAEIDRFIDQSLRTEVFVRANPGQGGGDHYKLSDATAERITDLDTETVSRLITTEDWLE